MARLSQKLPYSKITIYDQEYMVQFKVIVQQKKVECLIFRDKELLVRGTAKCVEEDKFDIDKGKEISFIDARDKLYNSFRRELSRCVQDSLNEFDYMKKQLTYKCFKKEYI
mgnify:CR=1 FL=1